MSGWKKKRKEILVRDNFTCQQCGGFNPEGVVELRDKIDGEIELHEYFYHPDPYKSEYRISQSRTGYTFEINFGDCWPVFPIMQVHHKRYVNGRERWDYGDEDLITLCKKCHTNLHLKKKIPIYSTDNILIEKRAFLPEDLGYGRQHKCDDWTFIKRHKGSNEYVVSNINPTIGFVALGSENEKEVELEGKKALDNLLRKYFPRYHKI